MEWSPQDAMQAYLNTLHLCKVQNEKDQTNKANKLVEPKCAEFIAALAAGKRARLMVEVTADGITPLTIALAAAAKQTGGRLVCILLRRDHVEPSLARLLRNGLDHVVELQHCCGNPSEVIGKYRGVDFAVIDCKLGDHVKLYRALNLNPRGSTVVASNLDLNNPFLEVLKLAGKNGVESHLTLPLAGEFGTLGLISTTRFPQSKNDGYICKRQKIRSRKHKRFHVTFEN